LGTRATTSRDGWSGLFATAFAHSRNAMVLADAERRHVDANAAYLLLLGHRRGEVLGRPLWDFVVGGPVASPQEWAEALSGRRITGSTDLLRSDGTHVAVQWGSSTEVVTGRRLVLFVALNASTWGRHFRRTPSGADELGSLSARELEVVRLIASGMTGREIAEALNISHDTVRTHVRNAMVKLGARSRAHLVAKALGDGLVL
jgi:PAS domain S-box-containing protein